MWGRIGEGIELTATMHATAAIRYHRHHFDPDWLKQPSSFLGRGGGLLDNVTSVAALNVVRTPPAISSGAVERITKYGALCPPSLMEAAAVSRSRARPTAADGADWLALQQSALGSAAMASKRNPMQKKKRKIDKMWTCAGVNAQGCSGPDNSSDLAVAAAAAFASLVVEAQDNLRIASSDGHDDVDGSHVPDGMAATGALCTRQVPCQKAVGDATEQRERCVRTALQPYDLSPLLKVAADQASSKNDIIGVCRRLDFPFPAWLLDESNTAAVRNWALQQCQRTHNHGVQNAGELTTSALLCQSIGGNNGDPTFFSSSCVGRKGSAAAGTTTHGVRCADCANIKKAVRQAASSALKKRKSPSKSPEKTPHAALSSEDSINRMRLQSKRLKQQDAHIKRLTHRLDHLKGIRDERAARCSPVSTTSSLDDIKAVAASYHVLDGVGKGGKLLVGASHPNGAEDRLPRKPGMEEVPSLLDEAYPPGSLSRAYIDTCHNNVMCQIATGSSTGFRFDAQVQHLALGLMQKAGKSMYTEIAKVIPGLPSYRSMSDARNFVSPEEAGPLRSVLEAMRYTYERKGVMEGDPDRIGVLSTDELHMEGGWSWCAATKTVLGQGTLDQQLFIMKNELEREYKLKVERATGAAVKRAEDPNVVATR